jgi:CxxC-x17-CxxC domain-containing protein
MKNFNRGPSFGGGNFKKSNFGGGGFKKNFGGGFKKQFGGGYDAPQMFPAVCNECGKQTEVPFRPNGKKPVLCRDCFQRENGQEPRGQERQERRFERNGFNARPDFRKHDDRPAAPAHQPSQYKKDFEALNAKLDRILALLSPVATTAPEEPARAPRVSTMFEELGAYDEAELSPAAEARVQEQEAVAATDAPVTEQPAKKATKTASKKSPVAKKSSATAKAEKPSAKKKPAAKKEAGKKPVKV